MTLIEFRQALKMARKARYSNARDWAKAAGVGFKYVAKLENIRSYPNYDPPTFVVQALLKPLDLSLSVFFRRIEGPEADSNGSSSVANPDNKINAALGHDDSRQMVDTVTGRLQFSPSDEVADVSSPLPHTDHEQEPPDTASALAVLFAAALHKHDAVTTHLITEHLRSTERAERRLARALRALEDTGPPASGRVHSPKRTTAPRRSAQNRKLKKGAA